MRRSNKLFASVLCAAAVFTLALTGCAGKSESNNSNTSQPVSQAASSSAKASSAVSSAASSAASSATSSAASSKASTSSAASSAKTSSASSSAKTSSAASSKTSASSSKAGSATTNSTTVKGTLYTKQGVNLRKGPGLEYDVITEVPGKAKVNVYGESKNWSEVDYNGKRGFISNYYLLEKLDSTETVAASTEKATVELGTMYVTSGVNLRKTASKDGEVLTTMPRGAQVEVTGSENGWIKVKYNGMEGFMGSSYLSKTKPQ